MIDEEAAILRAVKDDPESDTARLVLADWLEEHDQSERAEFVRRQVTSPSRTPDHRAAEILQRNYRSWLDGWASAFESFNQQFDTFGPSPDNGWVEGWWFRRGLLRLRLPLGRLVALLETRATRHRPHLTVNWLETLLVTDPDVDGVRILASHPILEHVVELSFQNFRRIGQFGDAAARALGRSAYARSIRKLDARSMDISRFGVEVLASGTVFEGLRELDLTDNPIGDNGAVRIAESPYSSSLRRLVLRGCQIGDTGMIALAKSPYLHGLQYLNLQSNSIGNDGALAMLESANWSRLIELDLSNNHLDTVTRRAVYRHFPDRVRQI